MKLYCTVESDRRASRVGVGANDNMELVLTSGNKDLPSMVRVFFKRTADGRYVLDIRTVRAYESSEIEIQVDGKTVQEEAD